MGDFIERWKEHFEEHLNPNNMSSVEEASSEALDKASSISLAEVAEIVKKLLVCMRFAPLVFADGVVLLASLDCLQFAAEWEAA